ncbi:MAG: hypothetical protein V7K35_16825 [Nostoc sp.]
MVKARDAINRSLYNNQSFVLTAVYRGFGIYYFHQITLSEPYWNRKGRKGHEERSQENLAQPYKEMV